MNSGTCFRTPDAVLERWREGLRARRADARGARAALRARRARAQRRSPCRRSWRAPTRTSRAAARSGSAGRATSCTATCAAASARACAPTAARRTPSSTSASTYVPKAHAAGATTYTGVRARRIERRGRRATGVEAATAGGGRLRVHADTVVVAAGAIHTPALLAAQRARRRVGAARAQPLPPPRDGGVGRDGRGRRHGARRPAVLLRRRVRRRRDHARGHRGPARLRRDGPAAAGERHAS